MFCIVLSLQTKCEKYWPDQGQTTAYGDYSLTNVKETSKEFYTVREWKLNKVRIYSGFMTCEILMS